MSKPAVQTNSEHRYRFGKGEDLREAAQRILSEQLSRAVEVLSRPGNSLQEAVHEARRCIKRTRSLLRLVKFAIPATYARENRRLRDVGRSLSELRDSHALVTTLEDLEKDENVGRGHPPSLPVFEGARTFLESRGQEIAKDMEEGGMERSVAKLKLALTAIEKLSFAKLDPQGIAKSLFRSVKRGMKAFATAEHGGEAEKYHEWRKRAKDLRYQLSLLSELRPDLQPYSKAAKDLEQLLGDDHNLAVLLSLLGEAQFAEIEQLHSLQTKISGRQSALRDRAKKLGRQLYGDKRKKWKHRLAATAIDA
ncbi:MAG: CHAD domain-containing protein [Bryobacteraceae bacterium]